MRLARLAHVAAIGGGAAALVASGLMSCQFAQATGSPCPGCGLTRATLAIARGDLAHAFALQPYAFVVSPLVAVCGLVLARVYVTGAPWSAGRLGRWMGPAIGALAVSMTAFWLARFYGFWGGPVPV